MVGYIWRMKEKKEYKTDMVVSNGVLDNLDGLQDSLARKLACGIINSMDMQDLLKVFKLSAIRKEEHSDIFKANKTTLTLRIRV